MSIKPSKGNHLATCANHSGHSAIGTSIPENRVIIDADIPEIPVVSRVQNAVLKTVIVIAALMTIASVIEIVNAIKIMGCCGIVTLKKILLIRKVGNPRMNR